MRTAQSLRRLSLTGVWSGLAAFVPYAEPLPWLELQTIVVFAAGYFLGARGGAAVGALGMAIYSLVNPYGPAHPLVFAAQLAGRAAAGALGGGAAGAGLAAGAMWRGVQLVLWSLAASLVFDLPTNLATGVVFGPLVPVLVAAIPFAALHALTNAALFWAVGLPLTRGLDARRSLLLASLLVSVAALPARAAPADTAQAVPSDTAPAARSDTARAARPDTLSGPAPVVIPSPVPESLRVPLRRTSAVVSRPAALPWAFVVPPEALYRWRGLDPDDALPLLGAAPRFYGDAGSVEEVSFGAMPGALARGYASASPTEVPSTPWSEPERVPDGGIAAWAWSPRARHPSQPFAGTGSFLDPWLEEERSEPSSRPAWGAEEARAVPGRPLTSVWVATGSEGRRAQGFDLQFWQSVGALYLRGRWSAWSRNTGVLGRLGETGSHGNLLGLEARGLTWQWELEYRASRAALGDIGSVLTENRGSTGGRTRFGWRSLDGRREAGLAAGLEEERTTGEHAVEEPLTRLAGDLWVRAFAGTAAGAWRLTGEAGYGEQRVEHRLSDTTRYAPPHLDEWSLLVAMEGRVLGGETRLALEAQEAASQGLILPALDWSRALGAGTRLWLGAGVARRSRIAEAGKLADPLTGPDVERTTGATGTLGLRWGRRWAEEAAATPSRSTVPLPGGTARAELGLVAWSIEGAVFPAYALFGREILEGFATVADVEGAAAVGRVEWAPLAGAEAGAAGFGALREVPAGVASGVPDYRVLLWAGPRVHLFHSSVEFHLRAEADRIGPRPLASGSLPAYWRVGGRASLGFGDAWLVLRAVDLVGAEEPMPGEGPDNVPLTSPPTQWRLYGEWRLLD
jgi:uncharacterized membrane protein